MSPRSSLSVVASLGFVLLGLGTSGCEIGLSNPESNATEPKLNDYEAGGGSNGSAPAPADAAANVTDPAANYEGSPLCRLIASARCNPDEANSCAPSFDAGSAGSDSGSSGDSGGSRDDELGCRVKVHGNMPSLTCAESGSGTDGDACHRSSDCASGYDCVGSGQCRHYCCDLSCDSDGRQGFCDIATLFEQPNAKIPVCTPIKPCKLLANEFCAGNTTCAIVSTDGETSCVDVGPAKVGESCEKEHCGQNLVCLGPVGERVCAQLCHVGTKECTGISTYQKCRTSAPLFEDPMIGICE